ncbi:hypothetical protein PVL29_014575 [Vitis rotundifolia]|uniref:Nas2 N-terminal domain-containing protein n=1 Tax=Vitis rotundifolia TaxID=103349 RepID=A0AA39DM60_VITRO|nr:hypothetical protein PVL29_014575 [Vitis rotundifolia]
MVGANLKAEAMALMDRRTELEAQMNAIIQRLCQPGGPGISGSLVDSEGFPRSDIDIPTVRAERQRLADNDEGSNNQDSSTATAVASAASHNVLPRDALTAMDVDATVSLPFAVVDEIAEASPAAEDGLQLGDRIVKFGNVEAGDNLLPRLASEAQTNHGHAIPVIVMRQGALINLTMTPRTWQGRGLLGCHFQML